MTATVFTELRGGSPARVLTVTALPHLDTVGYVETEYAAAGTARRFVDAGAAADPLAVLEADSAPFCTRVVVRRPRSATASNATVIMEWLNVSSGTDAAPEWNHLAPEILRSGYTWVGVSAQFTGVMGGDSSVTGIGPDDAGLAAFNARRYAAMRHPGDAYCYDIFAQIARALRPDGHNDHPLAGLRVDHILAIGSSQSAMALTTFVNRVAPQRPYLDGFLLHSRSSTMLPLGEAHAPIDVDASYGGTPVPIRSDIVAPVLVAQTETDLVSNLAYYTARQPDTDLLRVWEMAGTAHADFHQIGRFEEMLGCPTPVNRGQQRFVLRAGLHHLRNWAREHLAPPTARPLQIRGGERPALVVDEMGNACGGVRTPRVEVPTEVLSGVVTANVSRVCVLFGSTVPLDPNLLRRRYTDRRDYLSRYARATAETIDHGFILAADHDAVIADANPDPIPE